MTRLRDFLSTRLAAGVLLGVGILAGPAQAERVKDIVTIQGVRPNQLIGYGLLVGLDGGGEKNTSAPYTEQSLRNLLTQLGVVVPPVLRLKPKNVAAGSLTAELAPFGAAHGSANSSASSPHTWRRSSARVCSTTTTCSPTGRN